MARNTKPIGKKAPAPERREPVSIEAVADNVIAIGSGLTGDAVKAFIINGERNDAGTTRYPWPDAFKEKVFHAVAPLGDVPAIKAKINEMVVKEFGPGLLGKGPY